MKQAIGFYFQVPSLSIIGLNLGALTPSSSVLFRCLQIKENLDSSMAAMDTLGTWSGSCQQWLLSGLKEP